MHPVPAKSPVACAVEIRSRDPEDAAALQEPAAHLERFSRVVQMLDHVVQRDRIECMLVSLGEELVHRGASHGHVRHLGGVRSGRIRVDPLCIPAGRPHQRHEVPGAGTDVEDASSPPEWKVPDGRRADLSPPAEQGEKSSTYRRRRRQLIAERSIQVPMPYTHAKA